MRYANLVTAVSVCGSMTLPARAVDLYDNGPVDGVNGYSNGTANAFGARRTLLDDFTVPAGETWQITEFHWRSVWGAIDPVGLGIELSFRSDAGGTPGSDISGLVNVTAYSEVETGNVFFSREEHAHWAAFDAVTLTSGTYWWEGTIVGPEINFWLTADQRQNECWVNYSDFSGLESGTSQFGVASDLNFVLGGIPSPGGLTVLALAGAGGTRRRRGRV